MPRKKSTAKRYQQAQARLISSGFGRLTQPRFPSRRPRPLAAISPTPTPGPIPAPDSAPAPTTADALSAGNTPMPVTWTATISFGLSRPVPSSQQAGMAAEPDTLADVSHVSSGNGDESRDPSEIDGDDDEIVGSVMYPGGRELGQSWRTAAKAYALRHFLEMSGEDVGRFLDHSLHPKTFVWVRGELVGHSPKEPEGWRKEFLEALCTLVLYGVARDDANWRLGEKVRERMEREKKSGLRWSTVRTKEVLAVVNEVKFIDEYKSFRERKAAETEWETALEPIPEMIDGESETWDNSDEL
ncbi:hypothetical protein LTR62_002861 [Meristemomyces frigidus]|uniref:Uncharacterized protein n=1 Tax=Meristemomyces frigidus TaxID=1508187 RepID=A0AAN7TRN2_9PEZI|nr:hypothetical protein LTR62_002861 [Meristemomyces frigidus]